MLAVSLDTSKTCKEKKREKRDKEKHTVLGEPEGEWLPDVVGGEPEGLREEPLGLAVIANQKISDRGIDASVRRQILEDRYTHAKNVLGLKDDQRARGRRVL